MRSLPVTPERLLRLALGDNLVARVIIGDLREEYGTRSPGLVRTMAYWIACVTIALRYAPGTIGAALWLDLRHAARALRRTPTFTGASVLALAVGIGAAATLVTTAYGALIRPLPFPEAERLIRWGQTPIGGSGGINSTAVGNFIDLGSRLTQLESVAAHSLRRSTVVAPNITERVLNNVVTGNFFDVLSVPAALGRAFTMDDDLPGAEPTVVLSHRFWRQAFVSNPAIVGQTIRLDTIPYRVVGVLPENLVWPGDPKIWTTFQWSPEDRGVRRSRQIEPIGRLAQGASLSAGTEELRARFANLAQAFPEYNATSTIATMPLADWMLGRTGPNSAVLPLLGAVAMVLLGVAYLNIATLAIGRAENRRHEDALRAALGASRWRQWSRRWTEGGLIALAGGTGGTLIAFWTVPIVIARYGSVIPRSETIAADLTTLVIASVAAFVGATIIAASGGRLGEMASSRLNRRASTSALRLRRRLVAVQVGLACGLVYGAVLLGGTLASLARVDLGVPLDHALTFGVGANSGRYSTPAQIHQLFGGVEDTLRAMPGVIAVGATSRLPFFGGTNGEVTAADDPSRTEPLAEWRTVTPGFFQALGLPVQQGVDFQQLPQSSGRVAIISEALARSLFPGASAVGRGVRLDEDAPYQVVGVAADLRDFGPTRPSRPTIYFRHGSEAGFFSSTNMNVVLRSDADPMALVSDIRQRLRTVDSDLAVQDPIALDSLARRALGVSRTTATTVVVSLAGLALLLGMIGVFGVVAVGVEQRTREFGVRLAIGDTPAGIVRLILADGLRLSLSGLALGTLCAWLVRGLIESFLVPSTGFGGPSSAALASGMLVVATVIACLIPARRASRLTAVEALRTE